MPRKDKDSLDNTLQSLEQTVEALEEVHIRLGDIQNTLLPLSENVESALLSHTEREAESTNLQFLLNQIEIVARMLEQVELETDVLEKRISTIENLKARRSR
ncbi:MAG: hypothetical protein JSW05_03080 [Candidatus Thorarchaeota archaeon]|nr:MAG: hypothetical protein JSW05_03080 [Candidatus Thorarchaeota archaeon]